MSNEGCFTLISDFLFNVLQNNVAETNNSGTLSHMVEIFSSILRKYGLQ